MIVSELGIAGVKFVMDQRGSLSRRKLLHTLAGAGVIAAADLAWWDAPYIGARRAA